MISALLLAAGASTRFGSQKLLAVIDGRSIVHRSAEILCAAAIDERIAVVGREAEAVRRALAELPIRCVANARYADGLAGSIRAGISALDPRSRAVIIALGDQPYLPHASIGRLVAEWSEGGAPIVAASYDGVRGHPVLFDAAVYAELLALRGDEGARGVIARDPSRVRVVEMGEAMPSDVDVRADLERFRRG